LLWLRNHLAAGAFASGAHNFRRSCLWLLLHRNHFFDMAPTQAMSLCKTDCWLRLSHFRVTPDQFVSVTVAWSFLSSRQQTRDPTLKVLDWEPVIRLPFLWECDSITLAFWLTDSHDD
jgi:hypothetical protein